MQDTAEALHLNVQLQQFYRPALPIITRYWRING